MPECGVRLRTARPRFGNRARRGRLVTAGWFLLVPALLWLGGVVALSVGGVHVDPYKPVWLLAYESGGPNGQAAVAELCQRFNDGDLPQQRVDTLVAGFLADQADLSREWATPKGTFVEHAALAGKVSPADWQRYVEQGAGPALWVRPEVTAGKSLPTFQRAGLQCLGGPESPLGTEGRRVYGGVQFALRLIDDDGNVVASDLTGLLPGNGPVVHAESVAVPASAAGSWLRVVVDVGPTWPVGSDPDVAAPNRPPAGLPPPRPLARALVVPADQPTAFPRKSAEMTRVFAEQFHLGYPWTAPDDEPRPRQEHMEFGGHAYGSREMNFVMYRETKSPDPFPLAIASEVWIEWPGGRHQFGTIRVSAGTRLSGYHSDGSLPEGFDARAVAVRLVPSRELAESTPDVVDYWGEEFVWEDVRLDWPEDRGGN